jgi:hypothetical protein
VSDVSNASDRHLRGAELARRFFADVVEPLLSAAVPGLRYAAARLGSGSDVLGLDDGMSRDHDWGCRLTLLVDEDARDQVPRISQILEDRLPEQFGELPVRFPVTWDSSVSHKVEVATVADFAASRLGVDPTRDLVCLAFALSRRWAPYAKWRGTVFRSLPIAARLPSLLEATTAPRWRDRENALAAACEALLVVQRERGHPAPATAVIPFFGRPYRAVDRAVPEGLLASITDPGIARLPPMVGSIEQWVDSTDILSSPGRRAALRAAYQAWTDAEGR